MARWRGGTIPHSVRSGAAPALHRPGSTRLEAMRTCRSFRRIVESDPNVWSGRALQEVFRRSGRYGLASMYPASTWSALCSGPSWISARMRSHYRTGLDRAIWVTSVRMRREDRSPSSSHPLADLGGQTDYVIGCSSFLRCSFVRAWRPFLRPDLRVQARRAQGAVKVGRRAGLASRSHAARPCLDGPEHGARITLDGTPSHWSCRTRRCAPC